MKHIYYGPHIHLEKTLLETLSYFDTHPDASLIQTFPGVPIAYNLRKFHLDSYIKTNEYLTKYNKKWYIHAPYVINLASQEHDIHSKGKQCIQKILDNQSLLNEKHTGTILHIGSRKGYSSHDLKGPLSKVIETINDLDITSRLYLENAAQYAKLGKDMEQLRLLREGIDSHKVSFCIDTCHTHSNGMCDMRHPDKVIEFFETLDMKHGVIHLNDSKTPFKSGQDKHSVLGYGHIWNAEKPESFESLYALRDICYEKGYDIILETPSINIEEYEFLFLKH
jgi:deoxyribonuclease-4